MRLPISLILFFGIAAVAGCGDRTESDVAELQLTAPGMHCNGCTATVEETLGKMQGVDSVSADLDSKDVYVRVDTTQTSRAALASMIARLGFAEAPATGEDTPEKTAQPPESGMPSEDGREMP